MVTKVQKWGNSQGQPLNKELLSNAGIDVGGAVDVAVQKGTLVVTPIRRVRGGHELRLLVRRMLTYRIGSVDLGHASPEPLLMNPAHASQSLT